jgi:streptogramin lyase
VQNSTTTKRGAFVAATICVPVAIVVLLGAFGGAATARYEGAVASESNTVRPPLAVEQKAAAQSSVAPDGFIFRFDPALESFETITVPTPGANPHSVAVISNATHLDVWFTEPGVDKIGRLVYTATQDYAFRAYTLTLGSGPLNLAEDGVFVWFTARQGNYIGRVEVASGQVVTFGVPTAASRPSGIDLAPDGSVWFTEMAADKIGHLVVTATSDYDLIEYPIPQFIGLPEESAPYGIYVESNDRIWFVETARNQLVWLQPSTFPSDPDRAFEGTGRPSLGEGYFYNLTFSSTAGRLWVTELLGNRVSFYSPGTFWGLQYTVSTTNSRPYDLVADSNGRVWISEQLGGKLSWLVLTATASFQEYPIPLDYARPQGVAVDPHDKVWLVASTWHNFYLPLTFREYPPPIPPFGIQTYWAPNNTNGLQEMVDADTAWLRLQLSWSTIEPTDTTPENYNWTEYDTWFGNLHAAGIRPIVNIHGNPAWAAQYPAGPIYPEHIDDFVEFAAALAERYDGDGVDDAPGSPVVDHWEFYNEVDNSSVLLAEAGYGYWGYNGAGYADLLKQARPAIKAANPQAKDLMGGIAYERFKETEGGPYVRQFLDDFLAAGGGQYIDMFNFHYYPNWEDRWAPYGQGVIGKTNYLRDKLLSYGVSKPIACTEIGTHSDPSRGGSHELQSRYVVQAFVRSMAADLQIINWFALRDITEGFPYLYGLLDANFNPKPAYSAFDTLTTQLSGARYKQTLTVGETGAAAVEGYVFSKDNQLIYVVWTNDETTHTMKIAASAAERVHKYGATDTILDSDDGTVDGVITVVVDPSPVYLRLEP